MPDATSEKIRVLIVDDNAEARENLKKPLQFEPDIEVVAAARNGKEAIQLVRELKPLVILMDINMPDMDGITATKMIVNEVPYAQIVIVSVQNDPDYMRRAMLAGARDYLPKPPSIDELISTIRMLAEQGRARQRMMAPPPSAAGGRAGGAVSAFLPEGKVITVYSPKGGVGKSVIATNLALALHDEETKVVLLDGNLQFGDLGVLLILQGKNSIRDLAEVANDLEPEVVASVLATHPSGVKVLLASPRPELPLEVTADQVKKILQYLTREFAYVVVDTASDLSDVTVAILDVSDRILLLATPDIPAIKDGRLFLDLTAGPEYGPEKVWLVMNRMDKRTGITAEAVAKNLNYKVSATIANDERTVLMSVNQGVPLLMGDRTKPSAQGILELARTVRASFEEKVEVAVPVPEKKKPGTRLLWRRPASAGRG